MTQVLEPREVAPGVAMLSLRTPTLPPATHTNAYLIGAREFVVIEPATPYDDEVDKARAWIDAELARGRELRAFLLTHHHPDHIGSVAALRARYGKPIWAHAATRERLADKLSIDRELVHGERIELDGTTPLALECIHTPGHAPGHLCFLEPESRTLVAGDMVAGVGTIVIDTRDGDMQQYLESLHAMMALEAACLLPAHGLPIEDAQGRLSFYVNHRLQREAKVLAAVRSFADGGTLDALVPVAYADTPSSAWPFARLAIAAHLVKLERESQVVKHGDRFRALA